MFFGAPVVIPLVGFSTNQAVALVGGILVAAEVIWLASIPLLGKEGFKQMKSRIFSLFKPRSGPISRVRHQVGVWMFTIGSLSQVILGVTVMVAYFFVGATDPAIRVMGLSFEHQALFYVYIQIAAMACMIASVYVLGADFWHRLNNAFEWGPS